MTQCIHVPIGASGSSAMSARLLVFAGTDSQSSGGEMSGPSQVYFFGIISPSLKAVLVKASFPRDPVDMLSSVFLFVD